jgi:hypothetical protein
VNDETLITGCSGSVGWLACYLREVGSAMRASLFDCLIARIVELLAGLHGEAPTLAKITASKPPVAPAATSEAAPHDALIRGHFDLVEGWMAFTINRKPEWTPVLQHPVVQA